MSRNATVDLRWVDDLLDRPTATDQAAADAFGKRCTESAAAAMAVVALRAPTVRAGFEPLPFSQFVVQMAYRAGVAFGRILAFLGMGPQEPPARLDHADAATVRLGLEMGLPPRHLTTLLKLGCLSRAGLPLGALARMEGQSTEQALRTVEEEIRVLAEQGGDNVQDELRCCEELVQATYERHYAAQS